VKARFLLAAAAALAMVSCSKTEQAGITSMESDGPVPVNFTSYTGRTQTKANASLNQSFNVAAFRSDSLPYSYYFPPTVYKYSGGGYVADTVRYWPKTGGLDFYAVSPTAYKRTDAETDTLLKVSADTIITVTKTDGATDIVADSLMKVANGTETVALKFGHKLTKVAFKAKGADSLLSYIVKGISVKANSTGKYHFGEPGKWDGGADAYEYVYISETTKDTIKAKQSGAKAMGTAKYLIPAQGDKVEATVSYDVYQGKELRETHSGVTVSLPVTDVWGVNQSVVYTLTLSTDTKRVNFSAEIEDWDADIDTAVIVKKPAVFSVSAETKVYFSPGNLQATYSAESGSYTWGFAANQYDYIGNGGGNVTIDDPNDGDVVDLFGWSTDGVGATGNYKQWGINTSTTNTDYAGDFVDWGKTIDDKGTWRTLTGGDSGEWKYLLDSRTGDKAPEIGEQTDARYAEVKVNGVNGMLIFPDVFTWPSEVTKQPVTFNDAHSTWNDVNYSIEDFAKLESAGCVFLPAAGRRNEESGVINTNDTGDYWSSTAKTVSDSYFLRFNNTCVKPEENSGRKWGRSVRLVTAAQ